MKFRYAAMLLLAGCASTAPQSQRPGWLLLAAPTTLEYPMGCDVAPIARWLPVAEYPSLDACESSTWEASNQLQVPIQCTTKDDPRMKGAALLRVAASDCVGSACVGERREVEPRLAVR